MTFPGRVLKRGREENSEDDEEVTKTIAQQVIDCYGESVKMSRPSLTEDLVGSMILPTDRANFRSMGADQRTATGFSHLLLVLPCTLIFICLITWNLLGVLYYFHSAGG